VYVVSFFVDVKPIVGSPAAANVHNSASTATIVQTARIFKIPVSVHSCEARMLCERVRVPCTDAGVACGNQSAAWLTASDHPQHTPTKHERTHQLMARSFASEAAKLRAAGVTTGESSHTLQMCLFFAARVTTSFAHMKKM
jgi:hypothetical protein